MPGAIQIRSLNGNGFENLERYDPHHSEVALGICSAPDANTEGTVGYLEEKISDFLANLHEGHLERNEVWLALTTRIMKTLQYPMIATTLSRTEWASLMKPLLQVIKPKSGLASSFPHAVLYGPVEQHGMGLMDPFYHQELLHLQACLEELNKASFLNELLTTSFEELRLEMGFPGRITDAPADVMADAVTKCYTKTVWRFAFQHGFSIEDPWTKLTYAREKDQFLMRAFVQQGYTGARLYRLGVVRKYSGYFHGRWEKNYWTLLGMVHRFPKRGTRLSGLDDPHTC